MWLGVTRHPVLAILPPGSLHSSTVRAPSEAPCKVTVNHANCERCRKCESSEEDCKEYFKTEKCWLSPKDEVCRICNDHFALSVFPARQVTNVRKMRQYRMSRTSSRHKFWVSRFDSDNYYSMLKSDKCHQCKQCSKTVDKLLHCKELFTTATCWPAPTTDECFTCQEDFQDSIFQ